MHTRRDALLGVLGLATQSFNMPRFPKDSATHLDIESMNVRTVETFGGRADGVFDNTDAIHSALARIQADGGGVLQFLPGVYRFRNIDADIDNIVIRGSNTTLRSILPKTTNTAAIWLRGDCISMSDLIIDYDEGIVTDPPSDLLQRKAYGFGLRVGGRRDPQPKFSREVNLERLTVKNARGGGISVYKASLARVVQCSVLKTLGNGIGFDGCVDTVIATGNIVEDTGDDMLVVVTDASVPGGTKSIILTGNIVRRGWAKGIASSGADRLIINGNIVEETFAGGIAIMEDNYYKLGSSNNVIVDGNYVFRAGQRYGANMYHTEKCNVGFSIFASAKTKNIKISNNSVDQGSSDAIRVFGGSTISVIANTILNHPGSGVVLGNPKATESALIETFQIEGNQISVQRYGIAVGGGQTGRICGNVIQCLGGERDDVMGIVYGKMRGCLISGNVVSLKVSGTRGIASLSPVEKSILETSNLIFVETESLPADNHPLGQG